MREASGAWAGFPWMDSLIGVGDRVPAMNLFDVTGGRVAFDDCWRPDPGGARPPGGSGRLAEGICDVQPQGII